MQRAGDAKRRKHVTWPSCLLVSLGRRAANWATTKEDEQLGSSASSENQDVDAVVLTTGQMEEEEPERRQ